jgi:metacaspase-1
MKKALLIGIGSSYPDPYKIYSPPNDINNWKNTLQNKRGFTSISTLLESSATRANILYYTTNFINGLQSGDSGVIVFCGHGSNVQDLNGDEPDGRDECFVSVDMRAVTDDDIGAILALVVSGVKLDIVLDCCYAGTGTRSVLIACEDVPRIDNNIRPLTFNGKLKKSSGKATKAIVPVDLNHRLWAACAYNETSYEVLSGGLWQSCFSLYLCWALRVYPTKTSTEIMNIVSGYVTTVIPGQHPQLEGTNLGLVPF